MKVETKLGGETLTLRTPDGMTFGLSATEKISFFGATPVVQVAMTAVATTTATTALNVTCVLPINGLGNLGTFEAGWAAGYMLLGMEKETAFRTGFGLHIAIYGFALLLGAIGWLYRAR